MRKEDDRHDNDEGNRPSPIRPVHKLSTSDPLYEQQLLRDVAIVNERIRRGLGSAPHRAEATQPKRKPSIPSASPERAAPAKPSSQVSSIEAEQVQGSSDRVVENFLTPVP